MVRYWYDPDDKYHPMVFDAVNKTCYCISCEFFRNITTINDFVNYQSVHASLLTLLVVAEWIDRFKNKEEFRRDKVKEIAMYLLIEGDTNDSTSNSDCP